MNWESSWVVLGGISELPFRRGHYYFLPILFRLYLTEAKADDASPRVRHAAVTVRGANTHN